MNPIFTAPDRVEVMVTRPFHHGFDYLVPKGMRVQAGDYVTVPFGRSTLLGVVWGAARCDVKADRCKAIIAQHQHVMPMPKAMRDFIDWSAQYNMAETGMVLKMALPMPKAIMQPALETVYAAAQADAGKQTEQRKKVLEALRQRALSADELKYKTGVSAAVLSAMVRAGMIRKEEVLRAPKALHYDFSHSIALHPEQEAAAQELRAQHKFQVTVLDGVTGSGKTEVYFDKIEQLLKEDKGQALVLLPEIALATQWLKRFEQRFGAKPTLWHSSVSLGKRRRNWQAIVNGTARLVVGARSALYLPYADLRLIVVDEEHELSYKQEDGVLYHARDMAVARAKLEDVPIVLVSATPSLESVANVRAKKYHELKLIERYGAHDVPDIDVIDVRQDKPERGAFLSPTLRHHMMKTLGKGHQVMLFLNRRGYAPLLLCRNCGYRFECSHCSSWMVQHQHPPKLECHHCGARRPVPTECPECHETDQLAACGPGVERVREEVESFLPEATIISLTSDMGQLSDAMMDIIDNRVQVIIGTQLLAKGHHFPHLAMVGVVDADLGLHGGDLRASERTYQLLHQLAGRAGREVVAGHVYLQTAHPDHPAMQALAAGDRDAFVALELQQREEAGWPPYGRLAALLFDGPKELEVMQTAMRVVQAAPRCDDVRLLGPAPAPLSKLRNQHRVRVLVKASRDVKLQSYLHGWLSTISFPSSVRLKVDIDPYNFL